MATQNYDTQRKTVRKRYADWSEEYPNYLVLIHTGFFYMAWGRSAEVLNEILDYKLAYSSKRNVPYTGGTSLSVILDALNHNHINYLVVQGDSVIDKCEFEYCNEVFYDPQYFEKTDRTKVDVEISDEDLVYTIETLLDGVDPTTGEVLDEGHIVRDITVQTALSIALRTIQKKQARDKMRKPSAGAKWSQEEDAKLTQEYRDHLSVSEIAALHGRTTGAINSRLVHLALLGL